MERCVIIVNGFQPLTIITKRSTFDVAAVLNPPLDDIGIYGILSSGLRLLPWQQLRVLCKEGQILWRSFIYFEWIWENYTKQKMTHLFQNLFEISDSLALGCFKYAARFLSKFIVFYTWFAFCQHQFFRYISKIKMYRNKKRSMSQNLEGKTTQIFTFKLTLHIYLVFYIYCCCCCCCFCFCIFYIFVFILYKC